MHAAALDAISTDGLDAPHTEHPPIADWTCALYLRLRSRHFVNRPSQRLHNQDTARGFHRVQRWLEGLSKHAPAGLSEAGADGHVERLDGALRDRLGALTRKTHAFAKRDASLRWARGFAAFRPQLPSVSSGVAATEDGVHRSHQLAPVIALGLTEHLWSFQEVLTSRVSITPS